MGVDDMRRSEGWDNRLRLLIEEWRPHRFEWGTYDCCTFALADYAAIMEEDPPNFVRPAWTNEQEAEALLGLESLEGWANQALGAPLLGWGYARRGDIVSIYPPGPRTHETRPVLGVVIGASVACVGTGGMGFLSLKFAELTWRIGE